MTDSDISTFASYQQAARRTGGSDLLPENREKGLSCAAMGLAGEAGEVCDLLKKVIHHRVPLDEEKLKKEAGDVLWYLAHLQRDGLESPGRRSAERREAEETLPGRVHNRSQRRASGRRTMTLSERARIAVEAGLCTEDATPGARVNAALWVAEIAAGRPVTVVSREQREAVERLLAEVPGA